MRPDDLMEFGPVGCNGAFKSQWMQQRLAAARTRHAVCVAQHERIVAGLEARLAEARGLLIDVHGDYAVALGVSQEAYDNWCRNGARGKMPNDTWAQHCHARAVNIDAFLAQTADGFI